jgi:DNA-binding NtrC family response regulator
LSAATLRLPALRDRREDIPELIQHFIQRHKAESGSVAPLMHPDASAWLQEQPWPGNVRQLENVVRQALVQARPLAIGLEHVRRVLSRPASTASGRKDVSDYISQLLDRARNGTLADAHGHMISDLESELFTQAIRLAAGNQAQVARWLGVTRLKVREKLRELGLRR